MIQRPFSPVPAALTVILAVALAVVVWHAVEPAAPTGPVIPAQSTAALPIAAGIADRAGEAGIGGAPELPTIPPWPTMQNTPTPTPPPTTAPAPTAEPPRREAVNGVPWESIVVMPPDVVSRTREIFAAGRALGRDPRAFSKVGDSTTENPHFLARFDEGPYNLGPYAYLQPVIDHYRGSFGRDSLAVSIGLHSWTANDPMWAEASVCLPNETPVECEIRAHNPSILFIRLGSNDVGVAAMFDANIRRILDTAIAAGVVPIIGTKGDRHEGSDENNEILRRIAAAYRIPLWDYDRVAGTLPGRGLDVDGTHMLTFFAHDFDDPTAFTRGHAMHNLTALMVLDAVWRVTN